MKKRKKENLDEDGGEAFFVFVESMEKNQGASNSSYLRSQYILDAITEHAQGDLERDATSPAGLSILRLQTTKRRLMSLFDIPDVELEGKWAYIRIGNQPGNPPVWRVDAIESYGSQPERLNLISFRILSQSETDSMTAHPNFGQTEIIKKIQLSKPLATKAEVSAVCVRVLDVGQASCTAIHSEGAVIGYYDAGAPIFFHRKGFPSTFTESRWVPSSGFVVLSHWDFDHYSLALTDLPQLLNLRWYAPDQSTGYNGNRLKALLGTKLSYIAASSYAITRNIVMHRGTAVATDRNNGGFVLRISSRAGAYLLTGDVGYAYLPSGITKNLVGLGISHHGGDGAGHPPAPKAKGQFGAAVSYGIGNRYKHPKTALLKQHSKAGWIVVETAQPVRGDCWL